VTARRNATPNATTCQRDTPPNSPAQGIFTAGIKHPRCRYGRKQCLAKEAKTVKRSKLGTQETTGNEKAGTNSASGRPRSVVLDPSSLCDAGELILSYLFLRILRDYPPMPRRTFRQIRAKAESQFPHHVCVVLDVLSHRRDLRRSITIWLINRTGSRERRALPFMR
jgi:hypothetical protein